MQKTHNLLWTSGWDSTFRLLQIALIEKKTVQPIYIKDKNRKSLKNERNAIEKILKKIQKLHPVEFQLLLPLKIIDRNKIHENEAIKNSFLYLKNHIKIGSQYEWLAFYCEQSNITEVELCIDKDDISFSLFNFINPYLNTNTQITPIEIEKKNAVFSVFKYFKFPLFETNKKEMLKISIDNHWLPIMELTWFCHKPKNNKPCGKCNPCKTAIMKGLAFRIPLKNRLKGYFKIYVTSKLN